MSIQWEHNQGPHFYPDADGDIRSGYDSNVAQIAEQARLLREYQSMYMTELPAASDFELEAQPERPHKDYIHGTLLDQRAAWLSAAFDTTIAVMGILFVIGFVVLLFLN